MSHLNDTYEYSAPHDEEAMDGTLPGGAQTTGESSFSSVARKEWIHAVFGKTLQQPKGKGLAQIDDYLCTRVYIESDLYEESLGITLSRLTLGLYVRNVKSGSEAALAGVLPQSVLVSINDINLLAEPSKQALERIWQYEGLFGSISKYAKPYSEDASHVMDLTKKDLTMQHPMRMTFIRNGQLYSVLLLTNPPYGIEWAPCGNFALVKRNDGQHPEIARGSIIAGVNENPIDDLDHLTSATFIKEAMDLELAIDMLICWPPATARSRHWERTEIAKINSTSPQSTGKKYKPIFSNERDGVKTTVHSLFSRVKKKPTPEIPKNDWGVELDDLAATVGSGEVLVAESTPEKAAATLTKVYLPCSNLDGRLLESWDVQQSLLYNLKYFWTMNMTGDNAGDFVGHRNLSDLFLDYPKPLFQEALLPLIACCRHTSPGTPTADEELHKILFDEVINLAETMPSFAPSMELIATALQEIELRNILRRIREKRAASSPIVKNNSNFTFAELEKELPLNSSPAKGTQKQKSEAEIDASSQVALTPPKKRFGLFGKKSKPKSPSAKTTSPKRQTKSKSPKKNAKGQSNFQNPAASPGGALSTLLDEQDQQEQDRQLIGAREVMFAKTLKFAEELLEICQEIERSLLKTYPQRLAGWALQPWSSTKETALLQVTNSMRDNLMLSSNTEFLNPLDSDELVVGIDASECYILPSAHFPVLLTFDCQDLENRESQNNVFGVQKFYRTTVEIVHVQCAGRAAVRRNFVVHASVGGSIQETEPSSHTDIETNKQMWDDGALLVFDTSSSWGPPQTVSLRLSESFVTTGQGGAGKESQANSRYLEDVGVSWADLTSVVDSKKGGRIQKRTVVVKPKILPSKISGYFDEHGEVSVERWSMVEDVEIELKVTTQTLEMDPLIKKSQFTNGPVRKRSLLYKHDDDVRQDMFAIEFIKTCDTILKSCGLDMKLVTFRCIPMADKQGFVEWVHGSVPLSELSRAFADAIFGSGTTKSPTSTTSDGGEQNQLSLVALAGLSKYETLQRFNSDVTGTDPSSTANFPKNPVQDYLRTFNYDRDAPYLIRKEAMDTYIKSCAGYCAITYILGVGDRHLDNLLLHQTGHFFHCDYSFILGNDPKKYLPVRITEEMVNGMGGKGSDGFVMFQSLTCAAFLTLRRPENVRHLFSMIRMMEGCYLPDVEQNQDIEAAIVGVRDRLRLDLNEEEAIIFMENLIEESTSSKMWLAVDAIHTLGKRF